MGEMLRRSNIMLLGQKGIPKEGLFAEYLFNDNYNDTSGNGNNLTHPSTGHNVAFVTGQGKLQKALKMTFKSSSSADALSGTLVSAITDPITISYWSWYGPINTYNPILFTLSTNPASNDYFIRGGGQDATSAHGQNYSFNYVRYYNALSYTSYWYDSTLHHNVIVVDKTKSPSVQIWFDNKLAYTGSVGNYSPAFQTLSMGYWPNTIVAGFRIYTRALNEEEIHLLYDEGKIYDEILDIRKTGGSQEIYVEDASGYGDIIGIRFEPTDWSRYPEANASWYASTWTVNGTTLFSFPGGRLGNDARYRLELKGVKLSEYGFVNGTNTLYTSGGTNCTGSTTPSQVVSISTYK